MICTVQYMYRYVHGLHLTRGDIRFDHMSENTGKGTEITHTAMERMKTRSEPGGMRAGKI
jgi:hypothetical protein